MKINKKQIDKLKRDLKEEENIKVNLYDNGWGEVWFNGYSKNNRNYSNPTKIIKKKLKGRNIKGL